jgi:Reverse transcriptase (RNA-dependent DNA polymerase)
VDERGVMYTVTKKAMYGCTQASSMWVKLLTKGFSEFGYEYCPTDQCVMRKVKLEIIFLLLIYVDDIIAIVDDKERMDLKEHLVGMFGTVQYIANDELSYLGMQVKVEKGTATIDMSSYVTTLVKDIDEKNESLPGGKVSFNVDSKSPN